MRKYPKEPENHSYNSLLFLYIIKIISQNNESYYLKIMSILSKKVRLSVFPKDAPFLSRYPMTQAQMKWKYALLQRNQTETRNRYAFKHKQDGFNPN